MADRCFPAVRVPGRARYGTLDPQVVVARAARLTPLDDRIYRATRYGGRFPHLSERILVDGLLVSPGECCVYSTLGQNQRHLGEEAYHPHRKCDFPRWQSRLRPCKGFDNDAGRTSGSRSWWWWPHHPVEHRGHRPLQREVCPCRWMLWGLTNGSGNVPYTMASLATHGPLQAPWGRSSAVRLRLE